MGRRWVLVGAVAVVLLGSGCGQGGSVASPTASTPSPSASESPSASPEPAPGVKVHYDPTRDPEEDLAAALARAEVDKKRVLVDFGADWCPDCVVLHELFEEPATKRVLDAGYHVVPVDVGQFDRNLDLAGELVDLRTSGIPALVVLTADGTVKVATDDGSFANARTMTAPQVRRFLTRWAP